MVFNVDGDQISSVASAPQDVLNELLRMAVEIISVYEHNQDPHNKLEKINFAVNYQLNPVRDIVFGQKLAVQTVDKLHMHVVGMTTKSLAQAEPIGHAKLIKTERRNIDDPFLKFVEHLVKNTIVQAQLCRQLTVLSLAEDPRIYNNQINFSAPFSELSSAAFCADLQQLHVNAESIYDELARLFLNLEAVDAYDMPLLHPHASRVTNLDAYFKQIEAGFQSSERDAFMRGPFAWLLRLNDRLMNAQQVKEQNINQSPLPIFLRGFAYTLMITHVPGEELASLTLVPKVLSTGNALSDSGFTKLLIGKPSDEWISKQITLHQALIDRFKASL